MSREGPALPAATVKVLFEIYQQLILKSREEVQWCLSRFVKDQVLDDEDVTWLVDNWFRSVHLVNRLLKYPVPNDLITEWARLRFNAGDLPDRRSELIALLLSDEDISLFHTEEGEVLGWAILQSHLSRTVKIRHLSALANQVSAGGLVTFAVRLNAPVILREALKS
jgi:hypothetical protein